MKSAQLCESASLWQSSIWGESYLEVLIVNCDFEEILFIGLICMFYICHLSNTAVSNFKYHSVIW